MNKLGFFDHLWASRQVMCCVTMGFETAQLSLIDPALPMSGLCSQVNKNLKFTLEFPLPLNWPQAFQIHSARQVMGCTCGVGAHRAMILRQGFFLPHTKMSPCGQSDGMHSCGCCREGLVLGSKPLVGAEQTATKAQAALHAP